MRVIVVSFVLLILAGTFLLTLPVSSAAGGFTHPLDALFTATSATCVTGLSVVDTTSCWSPFGQAVVLGILCNILVCAGAMCSLCGQTVTGRAAGAFVPVCFFIIGGFEHCVANMYYIPAGILAAGLPGGGELAQAAGADLSALGLAGLLRNLIPVTIGNVIGGCGFGALIWAVHRTAEG